MKSITYDVEIIPDEIAEYISDSVLIDEISHRLKNKSNMLELLEEAIETEVNYLSNEDYKILREIFIKYNLDREYRNIYEVILEKV